MDFSDDLPLQVYKINEGQIDTFVRFEKGTHDIKEVSALLEAYRTLWTFLDNKKELEDPCVLEVWQMPIPFSRTLGYATLFRMNPYDCAYLVSPVRMPWLEIDYQSKEKKK